MRTSNDVVEGCWRKKNTRRERKQRKAERKLFDEIFLAHLRIKRESEEEEIEFSSLMISFFASMSERQFFHST